MNENELYRYVNKREDNGMVRMQVTELTKSDHLNTLAQLLKVAKSAAERRRSECKLPGVGGKEAQELFARQGCQRK